MPKRKSARRRRDLAAKRRAPKWLEHKFARAGQCANDECRRPLLKGDRIFWVAKATAYCQGCGEGRDSEDRDLIEFEDAMRSAKSESAPALAAAVDW